MGDKTVVIVKLAKSNRDSATAWVHERLTDSKHEKSVAVVKESTDTMSSWRQRIFQIVSGTKFTASICAATGSC